MIYMILPGARSTGDPPERSGGRVGAEGGPRLTPRATEGRASLGWHTVARGAGAEGACDVCIVLPTVC